MATTPFKVGGSGNQTHSHNQRGRAYVLMLILAFGAAILGVMVLHKLRERRIFTTLVKQKDHELLTLHLLLQREQEFNKQARKKIEEMKTKVYSLRSQKLELDRRLSEMESTISTLRDERKVIESTLEKKKNEIKMLMRRGMNTSSELISLVDSLKAIIKMKEAEIEDLRRKLQNSVNVGFTNNSTKDERIFRNESITQNEDRHTINGEARELGDEESILIGRDENAENKTTDSQSNRGLKIAEKKVTGTSKGLGGENGGQENERHTSFSTGSLMLEKLEFEHGLGSRERRQHFKGKSWRDGGKNRRLGQSLYSVGTGMAALNRDNSEKATESTAASDKHSKIFAVSDKWKQTGETGGNSRTRQKDAKLVEDQEQSTSVNAEQDNNENVKSELLLGGKKVKIAGIAGNDRQRKSGKKSSRLEDQEASEAMGEKMQTTDLNKHKNDNEQENSGEKEAPEAEKEEDSETQEPDINRVDVQRFSESDHEDETEETEF